MVLLFLSFLSFLSFLIYVFIKFNPGIFNDIGKNHNEKTPILNCTDNNQDNEQISKFISCTGDSDVNEIRSIFDIINRSRMLIDNNKPTNISMDEQYESEKQAILADETITNVKKSKAIKLLDERYNFYKVFYNEGIKRICENCHEECLAKSYCEYCIRSYLRTRFSDWTSGNNDLNNLIQECQMEAFAPNIIIEWIPYENLQNIKYLTQGGCSEIYAAKWIYGNYNGWDSEKQRLQRTGTRNVILKRLKNVEKGSKSWFDEATSHLKIANKFTTIVRCYGLTRDLSNGNYFIVMNQMDMDLRKYLRLNHDQITWKERIKITYFIVSALKHIYREKAVHRDLHSGNVLYFNQTGEWVISDLGFCGPADKPSKSVYGNLPYIAPEVITGKETTFASDIYSVGMLMWEISSGQPPFASFDRDYVLAIKLINGMRPEIVPGTPSEYEILMKQCWDADPSKRPEINTFFDKIFKLMKESKLPESETKYSFKINYTNDKLFRSQIYQFENLPEPKNATEVDQEGNSYDQIESNQEEIEKIHKLFNELEFSNSYNIYNSRNESYNSTLKNE